jgi:hypothetical protein
MITIIDEVSTMTDEQIDYIMNNKLWKGKGMIWVSK